MESLDGVNTFEAVLNQTPPLKLLNMDVLLMSGECLGSGNMDNRSQVSLNDVCQLL